MLIISDFSKTFTTSDMPTTWSIFAKSGLLGEEYISDRNNLYDANIHFEKEGNIEMTEKWFLSHAELFVTYWLTQDQIDQVVMNDQYFAPREGVREFLDYLITEDIPLVIVTSGITNFVTTWFQKRYNYIPEIVFGNELILEEGIVMWVEEDSITCPLDKTIDIEFEHGSDDVILLGDNTEDTQVIKNPKISLGFTDEERGFAVKLGKDGNMKDVIEYLK